MLLYLDTPTLMRNPRMDTPGYKALFYFLRETNSQLFMPLQQRSRLEQAFRQYLVRQHGEYAKASTSLARLINSSKIPKFGFNFGQETQAFLEYIDSVYSQYGSRSFYDQYTQENSASSLMEELLSHAFNASQSHISMILKSPRQFLAQTPDPRITIPRSNFSAPKMTISSHPNLNDFLFIHATDLKNKYEPKIFSFLSKFDLEWKITSLLNLHCMDQLEEHARKAHPDGEFWNVEGTVIDMTVQSLFNLDRDHYLLFLHCSGGIYMNGDTEELYVQSSNSSYRYTHIINTSLTLAILLDQNFSAKETNIDELHLQDVPA